VQSGSSFSLGLGLHIRKTILHIRETIIKAHRGHVGFDSVPGQGATFWFTLPLALPMASSSGVGQMVRPASSCTCWHQANAWLTAQALLDAYASRAPNSMASQAIDISVLVYFNNNHDRSHQ
jgi:hypothetical protein